MEKEIVLSKLEEQLLLYDIFAHCQVIERVEITNLLPINDKRIERDLKDLKAAGLLSVTYSRKEKGYIHDGKWPPLKEETDEKKRAYLERLYRLGILMWELDSYWSEEHEEEMEILASGDDDPEYLDYLERTKCHYYTAVDSYRELFPDVPEGTWEEDFEILNRIGCNIYLTEGGNYEVRWLLGGGDLSYDYGVRLREDGKLVRKVGC